MLLSLMSSLVFAHDLPMHYKEYKGHNNYWITTPEIVICKSQTVFTKEQVEKALKIWNEPYSRISIKEKCTYTEDYGKIKIIDGKNLNSRQWGHTSYYYADVYKENKKVREYQSALVQLDRNVENINLLIHEIGHAFGFHHYDKKTDIMNSSASYHYTNKYPY